MSEKLYLYGVIKTTSSGELQLKGPQVAGKERQVQVHSFDGLGVVYETMEIEEDEMRPSRRNLVKHQQTIEMLMPDFDVLPFAFGTLVHTVSEAGDLLTEKRAYFEEKLDKIAGRVELSLKLLWKDMDKIFQDILENNVAIKNRKQFFIDQDMFHQDAKIELGKMVEDALESLKNENLEQVLKKTEAIVIEQKTLKNISDAMFANVVFFVDKEKETTLDEAVNQLSDELGEDVEFKYVGPVAPVNFID